MVYRWVISDLKSSNGSVIVKFDPVVLSFGFIFSAIATNLGSGLTGLEALGVILTRDPWFIALGKLGAFSDGLTPWFCGLNAGGIGTFSKNL